MYKSIDAVVAGIPLMPLAAGAFLVAKTNSFEYQLAFRYILPPIATNIYLFGFSERVARYVNSQRRIGKQKQN